MYSPEVEDGGSAGSRYQGSISGYGSELGSELGSGINSDLGSGFGKNSKFGVHHSYPDSEYAASSLTTTEVHNH